MENAHLSRVDAWNSEAAKILKSVDASLSLAVGTMVNHFKTSCIFTNSQII